MLEKGRQDQKASPLLLIHPLLLWGKTLWFGTIEEVMTFLESAFSQPASLIASPPEKGMYSFFQTVGETYLAGDTRKWAMLE